MADSVKVIDDEFVRRIHSRNVSGRLHKGHGITAATASIPSKYQTIVIDNAEKRGFNSRAKRFQYDSNVDDNPGPGTYMGLRFSTDSNNASFSKKGTGGFASKDRRIMKQGMSCGPGAAAYKVPDSINPRKDFNRAKATSAFHTPIARKVEKTDGVPAPNSYEVLRFRYGPANNVAALAAFKSKSKREMDSKEQESNPAPWQYHVNDSIMYENVKVPMSSFKSKSKRLMQPDPDQVPGPGTYKPEEPVEPVAKLEYPRKHYLCISAPAMPLPPAIPAPGPGSYELVDYEGIPKHYMSSAVFVSNTSRWTGDVKTIHAPGPAHYKPHELSKQSFIYNAQGRWI